MMHVTERCEMRRCRLLASPEETVRRLKRHRTRPVDAKFAAQIRKKLLRAFEMASKS